MCILMFTLPLFHAVLILNIILSSYAVTINPTSPLNGCFAVAVASKITYVKIHGNKAEVTREFEMSTYQPDSYCIVRVNDLTTQLEDKSVRVKGVGKAEIIESSVISMATTRDKNSAYMNQLAFLQRLSVHLRAEIEGCRAAQVRSAAQKDYVEMFTKASISGESTKRPVGVGSESGTTPTISVQSLTEILKFQDSIAIEIDSIIATVTNKLNQNNLHLQAVQSRIEELQHKGVYSPYFVDGKLFCPSATDASFSSAECGVSPSLVSTAVYPAVLASKSIEVRIRTASMTSDTKELMTPMKFSVTYLAGPAQWYPEYDIRLEGNADTEGGGARQYHIEVDYYAAIEQKTQEVHIFV